MVYAAKEYAKNRSDWKKVIAAYDLKGYHFLLNNSFKKSLENNEIFIKGYPSYALINSDGKIFKLENVYPNDGNIFYEMIDKIINNTR